MDCQGAGVANYVWWSYKGQAGLECTPYEPGSCGRGDMGSVAMFWVTRASIHAELILVDDHDGREMAFNTVLTAAWRVPGSPTIRILVTNSDAGLGDGYNSGGYENGGAERAPDGDCEDYEYTFALGYGKLDGVVKAYQYDGSALVDDEEDIAQVEFDAAQSADATSFVAALPCYTFTVFEFDVADDAAPDSDAVTFAADAAAYVDSSSPYDALAAADNGFAFTVDEADVVAYARFDHVPEGATIVKATLRVAAASAVDRILVATAAEPWDRSDATLTYATAPAFEEESSATLDAAYARAAGAVVEFDVTLAFSDARDSSSVTFAIFGEGSDAPTDLAAEWGPGCAFAYLTLESYGGDAVTSDEVDLYDEADVEAASYEGCAAATPVPTISSDCFLGGQDESCDDVCLAEGLECDDDYLAATGGLFQTHNMAATVQSFGASCDVMEEPVTWKSAPLIKNGACYPVGADKDDSRYKCDKVTTTTDAFRVCCCGSVVTAAPTTDDSQ